MKNTCRYLYGILLLLLTVTSCSDNNENTTVTELKPVVLKALNYTFDSEEGNIWKNGETFGVFMLDAANGSVVDNNANLRYTADNYAATGYLIPEGAPMYYPENGQKVNIVAYHPYSADARASGYSVAIDLSNQQQVQADDFIYSNEGVGLDYTSSSYELQLKPVLSRMVMNLVPGNGISQKELATAIISLKGIHTTANFDLLEGKFFNTGETKTVTFKQTDESSHQAVILPGDITADMKVNVNLVRENGSQITLESSLDQALKGTQENVEYEIALKVTPEGLEAELETASYIYVLDWQDDKSPIDEIIRPALPELVKDGRLEYLAVSEWTSVTSVPSVPYTWYGMANNVEGDFMVQKDESQGNVLSMKFNGALAWYKNYLGYTSRNAEDAIYQLTFKARTDKPGAKLRTYVRIHQQDNLFFVLEGADTTKACAAQEFELTDAFTTYVVNYDFSRTVNTINSTGIVIASSTDENRKNFYLAFMATEAGVEYQIDDVTFIKLNK